MLTAPSPSLISLTFVLLIILVFCNFNIPASTCFKMRILENASFISEYSSSFSQ